MEEHSVDDIVARMGCDRFQSVGVWYAVKKK
jgi:hypothetical protein